MTKNLRSSAIELKLVPAWLLGSNSADMGWQANIKLEAYGYALADATKAIELDPNYVKVRRLASMGTRPL